MADDALRRHARVNRARAEISAETQALIRILADEPACCLLRGEFSRPVRKSPRKNEGCLLRVRPTAGLWHAKSRHYCWKIGLSRNIIGEPVI